MKRKLCAALTAFALITGSQALAQTTIQISPELRTKMKEYIIKQNVNPVSTKEQLAVGATVPANVALEPAPAAWGDAIRYSLPVSRRIRD